MARLAQRVVQAVREAPPRMIVALGWLALVVYAYPGQMTEASFEYLRQVRTRFWSDVHPPAMSALWRLLELVVAGPTGMFLLQSVMFALGLHAILRRALAPRAAAWATAALLVVPPVMVPMSEIRTHSLMAGFLVLGLGALLTDRSQKRPHLPAKPADLALSQNSPTGNAGSAPGSPPAASSQAGPGEVPPRRMQLAGLAALFGATAIHPSALVATLPLVLALFVWRAGARRYLHALAAWVAITVAAFAANMLLASQRLHAWDSELASYDIAGTLAYVDADLTDAELQPTLAGTDLRVDHVQAAARAAYTPDHTHSLVAGAPWQFPADGAAPPVTQRDALARAARALALDHPTAYLHHRVAVFGAVLSRADDAVPSRELPDSVLKSGIPTEPSRVQRAMTCVFAALAPLYTPWLYLVLALVLVPLARRPRPGSDSAQNRDVLAILASGLALEASLMFTATTPGFHQSHWLVTCVFLAVVMLVARRSRA